MRKLLLLFTMMMVTGLTYAQLTVPFTENFEGTSGTNLPTGWTEAGTNSGGSSYTWRVQAGLDGKEATVNSPWGGTMNYWLFTSGITLQAEQTYILTFDYRGGDQGNGEKLKVHLGTEATIAGMGTESLFSVESIMHSKFYKTAKVIIKATASGTYYIGFNVENGTGGGTARVGLDNISLKIPLDKDVELTMEEFPPYIFADDVVSVSATLQNIGKEDLTYGLHGQLLVTNVKNGKQVIQKYQQSQPLASGEKDVLNFEEFTLPKGEYTMNVKADWWDDGNTQNNEKEFSFHVFDGQLYHYDNVENGQGQIQDVSYNWTNNPFDIAIKYTVEDLENLGIEEISLVRLWINRIENVNKQSIKIWQGNDGATEVFSQDFTASESRTWLDIILESPYVVDKTQDLYIGVRYDISMYVMPAAFEPDNSYPPTAVDGKSNLIRPVYEAGAGPWENKTGQVGSWKIRMIAGEHIPTYKVTFDIQPDENGDTPEVGNLIFDSEGLGNNTIVEDVEPGTYTYSIYFNGNYHFINDQPVEVIDQDVVVPITPEKWYNILFTVIDEEGIPIQDAEVKINDQIISFNNDMGSYTKYMNDKGDYTYSITKEGYKSEEGNFSITNDDYRSQIELKKYYKAIFTVTDSKDVLVSDAIITIDRIAYDNLETEPGIYVVENLLKGRYEFVVSKEGYVSESGGIDIDGQDCEREVSLLNKHTLTFDIKDDNGQVIVDAIITQLEATPIVFPAGQYIIPNLYYNWTHDFRIEKAGYETIEKKTITITGDETVPITLRKYYTVTFTVTGDKDGSLNDAVVKLGNTTNPVGNYTFKDLFKGDYDYEVKRNEYITKTGSLTITSDNVREVVELKYDNNGIGDTYFGGVKTYYNKFTQEVIVNDPEQVVKSVLITNSAGKHVINMNLNGNNTIYVGELPQGIYVVTLMTAEGKTITAKMVK